MYIYINYLNFHRHLLLGYLPPRVIYTHSGCGWLILINIYIIYISSSLSAIAEGGLKFLLLFFDVITWKKSEKNILLKNP